MRDGDASVGWNWLVVFRNFGCHFRSRLGGLFFIRM
jgi:hypothetical protein